MRGIHSAIYFKMHSAFLRNHRSQAVRLLAMLEDELSRKPDGLLLDTNQSHVDRFERIRDRIARGEFGRVYGYGSEAPQSTQAVLPPSGVESEFHKKLMHKSGRPLFLEALGASPAATLVHEADMGEFGRCDFVARDGRSWYVVEVKMGSAPADVVSQIDRYRLASELDMCMGLHDDVKAVVVAESFPHYVAVELSRLSVTMVTHDGSPQGLKVWSRAK